jgi:serine/threonine protein kinase
MRSACSESGCSAQSLLTRAEFLYVQTHDGDVLEVWSLPWATRLIDFGLSKNGVARGGQDPATASIDMHSLPWMAPEIIQGSQHLQSGDVYGLGMVLWELLTTHKPPVRTLPSCLAGGKNASVSQDTAGPCAPALLEMQQLEAQGRTGDLMRKLHGVPCPVLSEIFDVIQATQCSNPRDRLSAAEVAQRLADLEAKCQSLPVEAISMEDGLARYWREPDSVREEDYTPFSELTPFSSSSTL